MGTDQHYSLRWNDYTVKIVTAFQSLRDEEDFVDVTVACDGHHYKAHKVVLSACSPYFRYLLRANPCRHPIVILKDVGHTEMERLLEFMYQGEVNIAQDQLAAFLKTAESLKIRGLAGSSDDSEIKDPYINPPSAILGAATTSLVDGGRSPSCQDGEVKEDEPQAETIFAHSPAAKRRKRSGPNCHTDTSNTSESLGGGEAVLMEGERPQNLQCSGLPDDDPRTLKSEPEALPDVYVETHEIDPNPNTDGLDNRQNIVYPLTLAGPSGSTDSLVGHESGVAAEGCDEAINLSMRSHHLVTPRLTVASTGSVMAVESHSVEGAPQSVSCFPKYEIDFDNCSEESITEVPTTSAMPNGHMYNISVQSVATSVITTRPFSSTALPDSLDHHHHLQQQHLHSPPGELQPHDAPMNLCSPTEPNDTHSLKSSSITLAAELMPPSEHVTTNSTANTTILLSDDLKTSSKSYPCAECHKIFRHPMSLHHHRHVHRGTYTCHACGKVFSRRWDLHRHIHRSKMGCKRLPSISSSVGNGSTDLNPSSNTL